MQSGSPLKMEDSAKVSTNSEKNLNEIDSTEYLNKTNKKEKHSGIYFLEEYSKMGEITQKEKDIQLSRNKVKKNGKKTLMESTENINDVGKRRSTCLSNMISPSMIARAYNEITKIDQCNFNIFELDKLMGKKASVYIANEILSRFEFVQNETVEPDIFRNFLEEIVDKYDRVNAIYHNDVHATDVMQTSFTIYTKGHLEEKLKLIPLDLFSMLVAAFCHDFKHTGQNNLYHINSKSKIALRYNGKNINKNNLI